MAYAQDKGSGIYMIRNRLDGRVYVGQAANLGLRQMQHVRALRRGDHRNIRMQRAYERDGEAAFGFFVLERCAPEKLTEREQFWIDAHSYVYNICPAAGSSLGVKRSAETRAKLSAAKTGKKTGPRSREAVEKALATRAARWAITPKSPGSPEACARRAAAQRARWAAIPKKKMSAEARERMSQSAKNRAINPPRSSEARARMSEAQRKRYANG